ncbi:hypothetical protein Bbelb_250740 [Branchiostoma belcheri]|nr:hypothetical protein Bbelb_250740 [Branchiostoma belcheri]
MADSAYSQTAQVLGTGFVFSQRFNGIRVRESGDEDARRFAAVFLSLHQAPLQASFAASGGTTSAFGRDTPGGGHQQAENNKKSPTIADAQKYLAHDDYVRCWKILGKTCTTQTHTRRTLEGVMAHRVS